MAIDAAVTFTMELRTFAKFHDRLTMSVDPGGWATWRSMYMNAVCPANRRMAAMPAVQATREAVLWLIVTILSPWGLRRKGGTARVPGEADHPAAGRATPSSG